MLVHTGQNFDPGLSDVFFHDLGVRRQIVYARGAGRTAFGEQAGRSWPASSALFVEQRPDRLLILGDTNSGLSAMVAKRMGVPVFHMEAGNRCFDDRVPEEVNRRIIDHWSDVLLPYTQRSRENLLREGFARTRIFVVGNPIKQVLDHHESQIASSDVVSRLGLGSDPFVLATMHRAENVDIEGRLRQLVEGLAQLHGTYGFPVVCSLHPRTRSKIESFGIDVDRAGLVFLDPVGFVDFVRLERAAWCVITDSGTVQEETCLFGKPNVTIRDVTERPETLEAGSNVLAGVEPHALEAAVRLVTTDATPWEAPVEYLVKNVAESVRRLLLSQRMEDPSEQQWGAGGSI